MVMGSLSGDRRCRYGFVPHRHCHHESIGNAVCPALRYGQVGATIFTSSTFSLGAFEAEDEADVGGCDGLELLSSSRVPVISTLCPTCGVSFASLPSRRYSLAVVLLVPDVPAVGLEPILMLVRMNFGSLLEAGLVEPVVPVGDGVAFSTQPVTVIVFAAELLGA